MKVGVVDVDVRDVDVRILNHLKEELAWAVDKPLQLLAL